MPTGTCKLCRLPKPLQDSHLIPAAAYARLRDNATGKNPAFVHWNPDGKKRKMIETSHQVHDYVLCRDCEQILNSRGEEWVLQRLAVGYASPLYYALQGLEPIYQEPDFHVYATVGNPEFDTQKITHFALGIFYKAAVHEWRVDKNKTRKLEFGPYQESLRLFLLREEPFPKFCAVTFCLLPPTNSPKRIYSPQQWIRADCRTYSFCVVGLEFWLSLGKQIPEEFRNLCFATKPYRPVVVNGHTDAIMQERGEEVVRSGGAKGKLARNLKR